MVSSSDDEQEYNDYMNKVHNIRDNFDLLKDKRINNRDDLQRRNRQVLSERFSPEELKGCNGILEDAEALLMRGNESPVPEKQKEITGNIEIGKKEAFFFIQSQTS